jgi:IclR family acetate operon transcriptional repressor
MPLSDAAVPGSGTEAGARVADVILLIGGEPAGLGVSELARRLALSKAVVHRILRSLQSRDIVAFDASRRTYRIGRAIAAIGAAALRDSDLRESALPVLRHLREETGETAQVSALAGDARVYLAQLLAPARPRLSAACGSDR